MVSHLHCIGRLSPAPARPRFSGNRSLLGMGLALGLLGGTVYGQPATPPAIAKTALTASQQKQQVNSEAFHTLLLNVEMANHTAALKEITLQFARTGNKDAIKRMLPTIAEMATMNEYLMARPAGAPSPFDKDIEGYGEGIRQNVKSIGKLAQFGGLRPEEIPAAILTPQAPPKADSAYWQAWGTRRLMHTVMLQTDANRRSTAMMVKEALENPYADREQLLKNAELAGAFSQLSQGQGSQLEKHLAQLPKTLAPDQQQQANQWQKDLKAWRQTAQTSQQEIVTGLKRLNLPAKSIEAALEQGRQKIQSPQADQFERGLDSLWGKGNDEDDE